MKYLSVTLCLLMAGCTQSSQKGIDDASRYAQFVVYGKDSRTGICFACLLNKQNIPIANTMAAVSCDGPEKAGLLK